MAAVNGNWVDDDGNVAWADQCPAPGGEDDDTGSARYSRIYGWLMRIGDGSIPIPFGEMDRTAAVPIAVWLAKHMSMADQEWPDETRQRKARELRQAESAAARAAERVEELRRNQ